MTLRDARWIGLLGWLAIGLVAGQASGWEAPEGAAPDAKTKEALQIQKRADEFAYQISSSAPGFTRTVKGKPFSAEAVTETIRVLGDGQRIVRRNLMKQYRDREGRTRREQTLETLGPSLPVQSRQLIFLYDPVQGWNYIVDPETKVTRQFRLPANPGDPAHGSANATSDVQTQDLGKRWIEGLECSGTRKTTRIQAGKTGNATPAVAVAETWFSRDLEAVVESTSQDPRFGVTHYKLQGVSRSEPNAELFAPPLHYRMELVGPR